MPDPVVAWLLEGDAAIRWQTQRDLLGRAPRTYERERRCVLATGWGARLLALQQPDGHWGGGVYTPKWISTTYTLCELRSLGPASGDERILKACRLLLDLGLYRDGGINFWTRCWKTSETCVTGMALSVCAASGLRDERLELLALNLLREQMPDGGWNCRYRRGATHASFHTTISVLEALLDYQPVAPAALAPAMAEAEQRGREFLLRHRLFRSHRTGAIVDNRLTQFRFPPRWHYDVLRGLDYFQAASASPDPRLEDAIALVEQRRGEDGRWRLPGGWPARVHFQYEQAGKTSRWNTLRCLRVLNWWAGVS